MALSNYSDLRESIGKWSHREDVSVLVDDFILMVEKEMFANDQEQLHVKELETTSSGLTISSKTESLPTDFLEMREARLEVSDASGELQWRSPMAMSDRTGTGRPIEYTIKGDNIVFNVAPDQTYNIEYTYYADLTNGLSSSNPTNAVLTNYPDIYLFGCLWAANEYASNEARADRFYARFINAIKGANSRSKKNKVAGRPRVQLTGSTP